MSSASGFGGWLANWPLRTKVLAPVLLALVGICVIALFGLQGVTASSADTNSLYAHTARPLADLSQMRDMEGDSRVEVRDLVLLPTSELGDALQEIADSDTEMDGAITSYLKDHGAPLDQHRTAVLTEIHAGLAQWRQLRDDQLVPLVKAGRLAPAAALLNEGGPLAKADDTFGSALDELFDAETADAAKVAKISRNEADTQFSRMIIVTILVTAIALLVGLLVTRAILVPLRRVHRVIDQLADGDLTGDPGISSRDEVGRMAGALVKANEALRRTVSTIAASAGDLDRAAGQLAHSSGEIAGRVTDSAEQASVVAVAADSASESINTVAAGADEIRTAVSEIAQRATQAAQVAGVAVSVVSETSATMAELGQSSADIEQVLKVITSIAEQTNLLALNATIEAARAGESGKGFAVVAHEVKELAQQTASATDDIARRVAAIQSTSGQAITAINRIGEVISEINDHQGAIAAAVEEQTATTGEVQRSVSEAASASTKIAGTITSVAEAARTTQNQVVEAQSVISAMSHLSQDLRAAVNQFRT